LHILYGLHSSFQPGDGYIQQQELDDEDDVHPLNDYLPSEKLEIALNMAQSLTVLHGYEGGLIIHDDVQLCQWLRRRDNKLLLGDFNRAEIVDWNDEKGEYCKHNNGFAYGNVSGVETWSCMAAGVKKWHTHRLFYSTVLRKSLLPKT
jgi:hypothetical protein